jgi:hypothetical protein
MVVVTYPYLPVLHVHLCPHLNEVVDYGGVTMVSCFVQTRATGLQTLG